MDVQKKLGNPRAGRHLEPPTGGDMGDGFVRGPSNPGVSEPHPEPPVGFTCPKCHGTGRIGPTDKIPPAVEEVERYCQERGNGIDAEAFWHFYAAQGWRLSNGRKMADWRSAVVTWEKRQRETTPDDVLKSILK